MKFLIAFCALIAIVNQGCNRSPGDGNKQEENKGQPENHVSLSPGEVPEPAGPGDSITGTVLLTKEVFMRKVWDYNDSPREWKFLGNKPAIIDFYADWCAPCRIASPILEKVAMEYAGQVDIYKIDTEKERELASVFGIQSIPAFLYIPLNGKPVMMAGIGRTEENTRQMFVDNISKHLLIPEKNR